MPEQERHILYKLKPALAGDQITDAVDIEIDSTSVTGILANTPNAQNALERLDNTGLGAQPRTFTGTFFSSIANQDQWYGGRQSVIMVGARGQTNGNYAFRLPSLSDLTFMFDDLALRGLGEVYTLTIRYLGGNDASIVRNSLTIVAPSVSASFDRNEIPATIGQGASVSYTIERVAGVIGSWERLGTGQAADPVATIGEVVLQSLSWNNQDGAVLPAVGQVLQGYAFPVLGSNPNDGTLRQSLLDAGVSDRMIYDGDYVVWTAATFTAWTDGDNWFVINRNSLQRLTREESNFLSQVSEIDNRVNLGPVASLTGDALVWVSENPLVDAPFLSPSTDPSNPRLGDSYAYIGGRENRNGMLQFTFGQNRFNSFMTIGITPSFIAGHQLSDIFIYLRDSEGNIVQTLNLADDFTLRDDTGDWTNGTVNHYVRNVSFNYPFLATIEIWLTEVQRHFRMNPQSVDATANIENLAENQLDTNVIEKLNRAIPDPGVTYASIEDRLMRYINISNSSPAGDARFLSASASDSYPSDLSGFTQVSEANPRFQASDVVLFVAVPEPGSFSLTNTTADTVIALDQSEPTVDIVESFNVGGVAYFVYRVTGIVSSNRYEADRITLQRVIQERNDIANLQEDVDRIDAELSHAILDLPDEVVQVLDNEVSVTEESTPTVVPTDYNNQLAGPNNATQTVFYETSPNAPSSGIINSKPISDTAGTDRARRKLIYFSEGTTYINQAYLVAFDGVTGRDLIRYDNGVFNARVRVPAIPASTVTNTIYPAQSTRVSGAGIWQNIPALTFINGVPVPEADEIFFTRNIPSNSVTLNIQYRGHANGNIFGAASGTLAGVGGSSDVITTFTLNDGSEIVTLEIRWLASRRQIRASITERVTVSIPTVNDVEIILSFDETRTVPATNASTRNVQIENLHSGAQVFAMRPSATDTVILVGDRTEIDTGWAYTTVFGVGETGHLIAQDEGAIFLDYEDFDPIAPTITDLENHASLPQFGLFTTRYTHDTLVTFDTQLRAHNSQGDIVNLAQELVLVAPNSTRWRLSVDNAGALSTVQVV